MLWWNTNLTSGLLMPIPNATVAQMMGTFPSLHFCWLLSRSYVSMPAWYGNANGSRAQAGGFRNRRLSLSIALLIFSAIVSQSFCEKQYTMPDATRPCRPTWRSPIAASMSSTTLLPFETTSYMMFVRLKDWKKRTHRRNPSCRTQSSCTRFVAVAVSPITGTLGNWFFKMRSAL